MKDVQSDVEQNYFEAKAGPAMREYLAQMRDEAAIYIKPGYEDSAATAAEKHPSITFSAYTPPSAKKKRKVERTRFRETNARGFRQKSGAAASLPDQAAAAPAATPAKPAKASKTSKTDQASMKPGKKEKIRFGKAPQETLPTAPSSATEDAGAGEQLASNAGTEPNNPLDATKPDKKTRFSDRAKLPKQPKPKGPQLDPEAPAAADAGEVADRQAQSGPLGLGGNQTPTKKKKQATTTGDKTRISDRKKEAPEDTGDHPLGAAPAQSPAATPAQSPATTPAPPQPGTPATAPQ